MSRNRIKLEITSADIASLLSDLTNVGILLFDIKHTGDISFLCTIRRKDYGFVIQRIKQRGDHFRVVREAYLYSVINRLLHRPVFIVCLALLAVLSAYVPGRILFVEVSGNRAVPTALILEKANENGVRLGAKRKKVRSEQVKNDLLAAIPELQWAGINTSGCVAVISVEERCAPMKMLEEAQVANVVAVRDGRVISCVVSQGNPMCCVGDAVKAGQVLVSGYIDMGIKVRAVKAKAEILAQTIRSMDIITPATYAKRYEKTESGVKISLLIGKKLINFNNDSGISGSTCVKMYSRKYMTLPGGRTLPLGLLIVRCDQYTVDNDSLTAASAEDLVKKASADYLKKQMVCGQILQSNEVFRNCSDLYMLSGEYICSEMIGKTANEERIYRNGKNS